MLTKPDESRSQLRRIGWLHFLNDFTLDFVTPLLPSGVGAAWLGVMEGLADGIGQILKIFSGRASDRSGRRARWVKWGYSTNAVMRPLTGIGLLCAWPIWIVVCRVGDRVGKGLRGSATDALVADWSEDSLRGRAFSRMRMMDHAGATVGGLAAALAAWMFPTRWLGWVVTGLVGVTVLAVWIGRGLRDVESESSAPDLIEQTVVPRGWWPVLRRFGRCVWAGPTVGSCKVSLPR